MFAGIIAGITWAIASYILTVATGNQVFSAQSLIFVTFISTFIHDASSAIWATAYNGVRGNLGNVWKALTKTKSGKWVVLAALIGGPIGMTGYVMALTYMGASIGAVASAVFPAIGSVLAYIFLREKMKWYQWIFLLATLGGVYGLSYSPELNIENFWLGILGAAMCAFGWGIEAVILAKCLTDPEVRDEYALQIRQTTSALTYAAVILPFVGGWGFTADLFTPATGWLIPTIVIAGLFATISYLFYYKAISQIGASKAMALNVTYCAWIALIPVVLVIFGGEMPTFSPLQILCTVVVLVCGIFAAADFKEILSKRK